MLSLQIKDLEKPSSRQSNYLVRISQEKQKQNSLTQSRRWPPLPLTQASVKTQAEPGNSPPGSAASGESCKCTSTWGLLCQQPAGNRLPDDFSLSSRQFSTKTSEQCHHAVTEVPSVGLECDANPSQAKTADHTTKSTVSAWKAGRSVFSRCIKHVYIPQRIRKEHSFCLQMIICSIFKKSNL